MIEARKAWCASIDEGGSKTAGYRRVAAWCGVDSDIVRRWCYRGFPPHRIRQLQALGRELGKPFNLDWCNWPESGGAA